MNIASSIIVNGDDFGYSLSVNRAIIESFERSLISSSSLIVNLAGFADAVDLLHARPTLMGKIGIHVNITEGEPLSNAIRNCPRFCDPEGKFIYRREHHLFRLSRSEQQALYEELKMQLDRLVDSGIRPKHLDSHHHVHTEWAVAPIVRQLCKENGIERIRLTRNMGPSDGYVKNVYKKIFNRWQLGRYSGLWSTDFFGDIEDLQFLLNTKRPLKGKFIEIMVHPLLNEKNELVDIDQRNLKEKLVALLARKNLHASGLSLSGTAPGIHY